MYVLYILVNTQNSHTVNRFAQEVNYNTQIVILKLATVCVQQTYLNFISFEVIFSLNL